MIEKMSLEQFRAIKEQLISNLKQNTEYYEQHSNDENFDEEAYVERLISQHMAIQNQLQESDLSDIPFEEWKDIPILTDENHPADFSRTKANLDFSIINVFGDVSFKGCNIKNLDKFDGSINPKYFDEKTVEAYSSLFLSNIFSEEFKDKYYSKSLTLEDLVALNSDQLAEIKEKNYERHVTFGALYGPEVDILGIDKLSQLYHYSQEDYKDVIDILNVNNGLNTYVIIEEKPQIESRDEFLEKVKTIDVSELKEYCYDYARRQITHSSNVLLSNPYSQDSIYPQSFINENSDIFLVNANVPEEVKQRYLSRHLTVTDLIDYPEVFENIPVDYFMEYETYISKYIRDNYGMGKFQELVWKHPDVFEHISLSGLTDFMTVEEDIDKAFSNAVRLYVSINYSTSITSAEEVPDWLASMNFKYIDKVSTVEELLQCDESTYIFDKRQMTVLNTLGIENIKRIEEETHLFSHKGKEWSRDLEMFEGIGAFLEQHNQRYGLKNIDFKYGNLPYEEFSKEFAKFLDYMRVNNVFTDYPPYDWIQGNFRENNPEIFIDINAPEELKTAFYKNRITPSFLFNNKEFVQYLVDKDIEKSIGATMQLLTPGLINGEQILPNSIPSDVVIIPNTSNFITEYISRYGNEKFLNLCVKYGAILSNISIVSLNGEIDNEEAIEKVIRKAINDKINNSKMDYSYLADVPEIIAEYPELFIDFSSLTNIPEEERKRLTDAFYKRNFAFEDIKKYPELINILKEKNLFIPFGQKDGIHKSGRIQINNGVSFGINQSNYSDLELLQTFGSERFLQLCSKYGRYMEGISSFLNKNHITIKNGTYYDLSQGSEKELSFEELSKIIEDVIIKECKLGNINYYPDDAPAFLKEKHPELFLADDAPDKLKLFFYNYNNNYPMTFEVLQKNKDWLPFLKDKALTTSLLRNNYLKQDLIKFLELFGEENAIKLGINRAETVSEMMRAHQVDLMKKWYDKTGGKFIPDFIVMQNFNLEEADKFLASGSNWSNLMRIKSFAQRPESRDAMLKLAYSFGAFDQDQRGFKKLQELLTGLPRKIDSEQGYILDRIDAQINLYSQRGVFFKNSTIINEDGSVTHKAPNMTPEEKEEAYNKMIEYAKNYHFIDLLDTNTLVNLLEALKKENVDVDFSMPIFTQLYRKNEDGTYSLTLNPQSCPKSAQIIRGILEKFRELPIVTPDKAHQLFGGFELKYDPDFREFLLSNMDKILENPEYATYVSSIQKQFSLIKSYNSNRALTWDLAVSFVQSNKFTSVEVGNERVAEISSIAGYTQADFDTLQQIYDYGKQRTFSSIPRIEQSTEKISGKYTYEILRLDDPLAMAIGTLTDCCQELNNCAEVCMEHSMVDKNGRVFVIKDEQGNIVAQSWVWRNKDVLCFDNIEIPDKAFARASKEHPDLGRKGFTDEVFEIYKQAAHELIEADEKVYKELLDSGKITQEQYDGLRLGKVTVGLGYNDIAESLKQNTTVDKGNVSRPLPFEEPVKLSRGLYTSDSSTQYILEERDDRKVYEGETLPIHSDQYLEYTDSNFTEKSLLSLEKLEIVTKEDPGYLETQVGDYADSEHLVTALARNYGLNPETTRVIMNPNFAIIYDINNDKIKIGDLLFNTKVGNEQMDIESKVIMQMRLAIEQIAGDKEVDISDLNEKQKEMYSKVTGLTDEMDIERGVGRAR